MSPRRASLYGLGRAPDCPACQDKGVGVSQDRQVSERHASPHDRGILDGLHSRQRVLPGGQTDTDRGAVHGRMDCAVEGGLTRQEPGRHPVVRRPDPHPVGELVRDVVERCNMRMPDILRSDLQEPGRTSDRVAHALERGRHDGLRAGGSRGACRCRRQHRYGVLDTDRAQQSTDRNQVGHGLRPLRKQILCQWWCRVPFEAAKFVPDGLPHGGASLAPPKRRPGPSGCRSTGPAVEPDQGDQQRG